MNRLRYILEQLYWLVTSIDKEEVAWMFVCIVLLGIVLVVLERCRI